MEMPSRFYLQPRVITVTDGATGAPIDPFSLSSYALTATSFATRQLSEVRRNAYTNLRRDFHGRVPFTLKGGVDVRQGIRDMRAYNPTLTFVGRDGRSSTTPVAGDDHAEPFLDELFSQRVSPFGFPRIQTVSNNALWRFYHDNPAQFTRNANNDYRGQVNNSKHSEEIVSAVYLRGDVALFARRLKLVGGLRAEQTNIDAQGPLTDPTRNFQRRPDGSVILGANGRPLTIATDALAVSQLTFIDRGTRTKKEYLRLFPSLNASFSLRENLIARAGHYYSVGRPNFDQYAGGLTLPDTELPSAPNNRIVVNNAGIKAWSARSTNVRLEYYFEGVGQISVSAFRRDFENFHGGTVFNATPEFLALYSLDPAIYDDYDVSTQRNLPGSVRLTGVAANYKQALTFLPRFARGVQVFANVSAQRATGDASDNFAGYLPRSGSWGVSLTRERYNARVNWNYRGRQRRGVVASGASIEPGMYNWGTKRLYIDVLGEYYFRKRIAVFANLRNVGNATEDAEIAGPSTPEHAQFRQRIDYGALWTFGIKGTF
jgi:iron complex outermembrane recepter protein